MIYFRNIFLGLCTIILDKMGRILLQKLLIYLFIIHLLRCVALSICIAVWNYDFHDIGDFLVIEES